MIDITIPTPEELAERLTGEKVLNSWYQAYNPDYKLSETLYGVPTNRKIRIISIGAGLFGVNLAYWISLKCRNYDMTLFEKSKRVGGVWNDNRYPGVACDVPSHVYQYTFAPNPEWPEFLSSGTVIQQYIEKCAEVFDLKKYIRFQSEVIRAEWHEEGFWRVLIRERQQNGEYLEYEQDAEILVNNTGVQHTYQMPNIGGLEEFKGKLLHTANWDDNFNADQWKGKTVCILGSGASAVQVAPKMQPHVKKMTVFSRTHIWFAPGLVGDEFSPQYSKDDQEKFRRDPVAMLQYGKSIEKSLNNLFQVFFEGSDHQKNAIKKFYERMTQKIPNRELLKGFTPTFVPGCRRITPGDPFINTIHQPNVNVVFKGVQRLTENGVISEDGTEHECDIVVCATGYKVDLIPPVDVVGRNGSKLADVLTRSPDSYMTVSIPQFPNFFFGSNGPYWPAANGCLIGPMFSIANYVVQVVQKLQIEHNIVSVEPKKEAMEEFVEHTQTWHKGTVWSSDCPSWYKTTSGPLKGRLHLIWPGISLHYQRNMKVVRWEDYNIEYRKTGKTQANRFNYFGNGLVEEILNQDMDDSPHINLNIIDPRWAKAVGIEWVKGMQPFDE